MNQGESAASKARGLRAQATAAQAEAGRLAHDAAAWEAGAEGERRVADALSVLTAAFNVVVMHDRLLRPGRSQANLDHVVVSPAGVHLVDAKNWAGNVTVYQGSLWRHKADGQGGGSSQCMNSEVDKVRRMAESMESISACVVEPVLCLTGPNAQAFGEGQEIRDMHVVPVGKISRWLASRERTQPDAALPPLAELLDGLFPEATGPWSGFMSAPNAGKQIRGNRTFASTPITATAGRRTGTTRRSSRPHRTTHRFAKQLTVLVALMVFVMFGAPVVTAVVSSVFATLTQLPTSSPGVAASWSAARGQTPQAATASQPCRVLTQATISKALGVRVYPVATALPDTCWWGLRLDDVQSVVASASTGWLPSQNTMAIKANRAIYEDGYGSADVSIIVPQHAAVPGSKVPAAKITQPIQVRLVPYRIAVSGKHLSKDQARALVTVWARLVATALPQGPGADTIHR